MGSKPTVRITRPSSDMGPEMARAFLNRGVGRVGEPAEVTAAVLYLANASFTTGHILRVDGGYLVGRA